MKNIYNLTFPSWTYSAFDYLNSVKTLRVCPRPASKLSPVSLQIPKQINILFIISCKKSIERIIWN